MINSVEKIKINKSIDSRGEFLKTFSLKYAFSDKIQNIQEYFTSKSTKNVWRGMHLQVGKYASNRIIFCSRGSVLDFLLDLRPNSSTYLKLNKFKLVSSEVAHGLFVPKGVAHGFLALKDNTEIHYISDRVHNPDYDTGVNYKSIPDIAKALESFPVIVSERDKTLHHLDDFCKIKW